MEGLRCLWPEFTLVQLSGYQLETVCSVTPRKQGPCPSLTSQGACLEDIPPKVLLSPHAEYQPVQHCQPGRVCRAQIRTLVRPSPPFFSLGCSLDAPCMESTRCPEELLDSCLQCLPEALPGAELAQSFFCRMWERLGCQNSANMLFWVT